MKTRQLQPAAAAQADLMPSVTQASGQIQSLGSVGQAQGANAMAGIATTFSVQLTSASGADKIFVIGDPDGLCASILDPTAAWAQPDAASVGVAALQASFRSGAVALSGVNYKVTTSSGQFSNPFNFYAADIMGNSATAPLPIATSQRNNQFNDKLLTIEFPQMYMLKWNTCFTITVTDGEDVYLDFFLKAVANR